MRVNKYSVKTALAKFAVSQSELARKLGVSREQVGQWCRNTDFLIDAKTGRLVRRGVFDGNDYYVPVNSRRSALAEHNHNILDIIRSIN